MLITYNNVTMLNKQKIIQIQGIFKKSKYDVRQTKVKIIMTVLLKNLNNCRMPTKLVS